MPYDSASYDDPGTGVRTGAGAGGTSMDGRDSTEKPDLLFLCHTLPFPPDGGVWIRTYNVLKELTRRFDVTALCFERSGGRDHDVAEAVRRLSEIAPTEAFEVPQDERLSRKVFDHLRSLVARRVFTVYKHRSRPFAGRLDSLLAQRSFDLAHVDSLDLAAFLPRLEQAGVPVVCVHHNVESQLLRRRAEAETSILLRRYLGLQAELQEREEKRWCPRVALNVVVSEEDRETLSDLVPGARVEVVPNGVDVDHFTPGDGPEDGLVFVGSAGWFPNRDGMEHFCREVLPAIRRRRRDPSVTWVGSVPDDVRDRMAAEFGVTAVGYADDIRPHVRSAACYIVPLRVGGGSRLKILDAWAMGKAVVSTTQGCEGLDARDGENILVRDEPDAFAEAVVKVLEEASLRRKLGLEARETAENRYSWRGIGGKMNQTYLSLLGSPESGR